MEDGECIEVVSTSVLELLETQIKEIRREKSVAWTEITSQAT